MGRYLQKHAILIALVTGAAAVVLLALGFLDTKEATEGNMMGRAQGAAKDTIKQYKDLRAYYTANVVADVKASGSVRIGVAHKDDAKMIPLPATMIHDLSALSAQNGTEASRFDLYSAFPFPGRTSRRLDAYQNDAIAYFSANPDPNAVFTRVEEVEGRTVLRASVADFMSAQACVDCHNTHPDSPKKDWKLGDVRGVLEVSVPMTTQIAAQNSVWSTAAWYVGGAFALLVAGAGVLELFVVRMRRDAGRARDRLAVVAAGNLAVRLSEGEDEIGRVCGSANLLVAELEAAMRTVQQSAHAVARSTQEITRGNQDLASRTDEQASALEETSASLEEISGTVRSNAENTE
ncbi:MAG: DUF3365 domain-containing protein, partial [Planctomycetes bacterium]|nr:DUF3365 domain-containing protein [Planctomycetota bacterium]